VRFIHRASFQGGWIRDFAKEESADQARPQARRGIIIIVTDFSKKRKGEITDYQKIFQEIKNM
jgi:hypothetical protein